MNRKSILATLFAIVIIIGLGVAASLALLWTGPEVTPEEKASSAKIVQTIPMNPKTRSVSVRAAGSVIPSRKVIVRPQVSGRVIHQSESMTIGGRVRQGDELISIDPKDYELALTEARSNFEQARFEREVESGRQVIAQREWDELQSELDIEDVNRSLVLREPHLRKAEALMEKATNDIEFAKLQLSRTHIEAPFNAMITEESVEIGQLVGSNSTICELVGTDEFWIQVSVPFSDLKWIRFPSGNEEGANVRVLLDAGEGETTMWEGQVIRLLSDLDTLGRMARLIVSVKDPLGLESMDPSKLPLLLGSYVEVEIDAGELENSLRMPREALREGDLIWVVGSDNLLKIVQAKVLWTEKDTVLVENTLADDDALIVSDLRVALPEMEVLPQRSTAYPELVNEP